MSSRRGGHAATPPLRLRREENAAPGSPSWRSSPGALCRHSNASWRQPDPCGEMSTRGKGAGVRYQRLDRSRSDWTDTRDCRQPSHSIVPSTSARISRPKLVDTHRQRLDLVDEHIERRSCGWRQPLIILVTYDFEQRLDLGKPLGSNNAKFGEMPAQRVDRLGPLADQEVSGLQHHQCGLALSRLDRDEAHGWPRYRFAMASASTASVLPRFT